MEFLERGFLGSVKSYDVFVTHAHHSPADDRVDDSSPDVALTATVGFVPRNDKFDHPTNCCRSWLELDGLDRSKWNRFVTSEISSNQVHSQAGSLNLY